MDDQQEQIQNKSEQMETNIIQLKSENPEIKEQKITEQQKIQVINDNDEEKQQESENKSEISQIRNKKPKNKQQLPPIDPNTLTSQNIFKSVPTENDEEQNQNILIRPTSENQNRNPMGVPLVTNIDLVRETNSQQGQRQNRHQQDYNLNPQTSQNKSQISDGNRSHKSWNLTQSSYLKVKGKDHVISTYDEIMQDQSLQDSILMRFNPKRQPNWFFVGDQLEQQNIDNLKVLVVTWNMQGTIPSTNLDQLLNKKQSKHHVIAIGCQECQRSILTSIICNSKEQWEQNLKSYLEPEFTAVSSITMNALHLIVFVRKFLVGQVKKIKEYTEATGVGNFFANKGGIATHINIGKQSFLFINSHLASGQQRVDRRNKDMGRIERSFSRKKAVIDKQNLKKQLQEQMKNSGQKPPKAKKKNQILAVDESQQSPRSNNNNKNNGIIDDTLRSVPQQQFLSTIPQPTQQKQQPEQKLIKSDISGSQTKKQKEQKNQQKKLNALYDNIFWMGDMNYRIQQIEDNQVIDMLGKQEYLKLLIADQLLLEKEKGNIMEGFQEGLILFPPTYKMQENKNEYKSGKKTKRVPGWTDRILYSSSNRQNLELVNYECGLQAYGSDHRPVFAQFNIKHQQLDEEIARLVELKQNNGTTSYCSIF